MANKKNNAYFKRIQRKARRFWYENFMKDKKCEMCGMSNPVCLDWHHKDPYTKFKTISRLLESSTITTILAEIKKCICLCANCHRIVEHIEKQSKPVGHKIINKKKLPKVTLDVYYTYENTT